jgi:hypothetical protein
MYLVTSKFINIALALTIVFAVVQVCFYFTFKRKANVTDIDKNLWQLRLFSGFLAALIFLAILYLPSTGFYREIDLSPAARETAFQDLVYNQQRIGDQLDQLREVLNVVFMMSMFYLFGIGTFIGRVWRDRQKRASANDPAIKKPLGLEL